MRLKPSQYSQLRIFMDNTPMPHRHATVKQRPRADWPMLVLLGIGILVVVLVLGLACCCGGWVIVNDEPVAALMRAAGFSLLRIRG